MLQIIREARESQIVINDPCCVVLDSDRTPRTVAVFNEPEDAELFVRAKNGMMPRLPIADWSDLEEHVDKLYRKLLDQSVKPDVILGGEQDASKLPGGLARQ